MLNFRHAQITQACCQRNSENMGFVPGGEGRGCLLLSLGRINSPYYYKAQTHKGRKAELPIQQANVKES